MEFLSDLNTLTNLPLIGIIPLSEQSEAIRNLRSNLLANLEDGQKVILMVSESEGDGKTYLAKQLVDNLTTIGKKALYLNADLRGTVSGSKVNNDYVIIDSPALGKYNDANQLANFADATCYVVKPGSTSKSAIAKLKNNSCLPNVKFIINAIDMSKKNFCYYYKHALTLIVATLVLSACGSSEKIVYMQNADDIKTSSSGVLFDARIMPKDILTVTVTTVDPEAAIPFNMTIPTTISKSATRSLTTQPALQDYLVSNDGTIEFPIVGKITVGGLTKTECESVILEKIRPYLSETEKPIVTVRMSSYSISVLGEVQKPGSFQVSREKINIFEALAQAGDMTIYGVRDRVRLIREDATGKKEIHMLDLTDANIINSPYYYLCQEAECPCRFYDHSMVYCYFYTCFCCITYC